MTTPANIRQARSRARRIAAGGKDIRVLLNPKASAKLDQFAARGIGQTEAINLVLERSRPEGRKSAPVPGDP